jgi:hypothetical protein
MAEAKCPYCGARFRNAVILMGHKMVAHPGKP